MHQALDPKKIESLLTDVFEGDMHAKRILSLSNATIGVLRTGSLSVRAIGNGLATVRSLSPKHAIKQVDCLLSNPKLKVIKSTDFVDGVYDLRLRYNDEQQLKASWNYYDFESSKDCAAVTRVKSSRRVYAWFKSKPTANSEWEDVAYSGKIKNKVTWSKCDVGSFKTKLTVKTKKRSAFNYTFYNN